MRHSPPGDLSLVGYVPGEGCGFGVGCDGFDALPPAWPLPPARPPLAMTDTHDPMPRLPGLGFGLASGLGRAALHDATALVTTLP